MQQNVPGWSRRGVLAASSSLLVVGGRAARAAADAGRIDVAAIYTVPVEQQWVSRIHAALKAAQDRGDITYVWSENVANTDYERVMREYAEGGKKLVFGEIFGVERAARNVAKDYPATAFVMGSSFQPQAPNLSVFDNYIQEASYLTGIVAGKKTKSNLIGMVGREANMYAKVKAVVPTVKAVTLPFSACCRQTLPSST